MERFGLPFVASFTLAGLAGVLIAIPALRLHGTYLAIVTLALSILTEDIIVLAEPWTGGVVGLVALTISIAGVEVDRYGSPDRFYWLCLAVALLVTLGYRNVLRWTSPPRTLPRRDPGHAVPDRRHPPADGGHGAHGGARHGPCHGRVDRVLVLADGQVVTLGTPAEVKSHPKVIEAYLGADARAGA